MDTETLPAVPSPDIAISYDGQAGPLFGLGLKVAALTMLTLGIYRFWGKTEIRRHLWSRIRLSADRFEYTGTGRELFLGFLIVLAVLIPLGIVFQTLGVLSVTWSSAAQASVGILQTLVFLYLIGYAVYRARRYRLSRTLLRGIRFGQDGSAVRYGLRFLGYMLLMGVTLGIAKPVGDVRLYRIQTENTRFGNQSFAFEGSAGDMMGCWIVCLLLTPFTLGLSLVWYTAYKLRYLAAGTRFGEVRFALPIGMWNLLWIYLPYILALAALIFLSLGIIDLVVVAGVPDMDALASNAAVFGFAISAIFILIFGIFGPVLQLMLVTHRFLNLATKRLQITGAADFERIIQGANQKSGAAEGMADALDIGAGVEVGF